MRSPRAILVDLDATLLDASGLPVALARTCAALALAEPSLDAERLLAANQAAWSDYWPSAEREWQLGRLPGAALTREVWRRALDTCGCSTESVAYLAAQTHDEYARHALRLYEDVAEFFRVLRGHVPLGLVSNGAADTQRQRLLWFDLEQHFDVIAISAELGFAKPDPAIFRFALDKLGVIEDDVWHVGDSLSSDVAGARAAGIRTVWLNRFGVSRRPGDPKPDLEISSLTQVASAIRV